jgi:hypothetical protein
LEGNNTRRETIEGRMERRTKPMEGRKVEKGKRRKGRKEGEGQPPISITTTARRPSLCPHNLLL